MTAAKLQGNFPEVKIMLTLKMSKEIKDLTDLIAARVYIMEGVEDSTATLVEESVTPQTPEVSIPADTIPPSNFDTKIRAFNKLYNLACPPFPVMSDRHATAIRIRRFMEILMEEVAEGEDIINTLENTVAQNNETAILADISDWLGDIIVYCASELAKYGMRSDDVLGIIMASNMSKLGEDGKPIYDARGKVLKGPGYWKPEPMIQRLIEARIRSGE